MQRHYLQTISERVGPDPGGDLWKAQAKQANKALLVECGYLNSMEDARWEEYEKQLPHLQSFDNYVFKSNATQDTRRVTARRI